LNGKTVSTVAGSTGVQLLRTYRRSGNIEVQDLAAKDTADGFLMLASDRTAAYILDDVQLAGLIATSPKPEDFKILTQESLRQEPYGIMVRKDDAAFMAVVDKTVTELMTSGAIHEIYAKWFTRPIPPNNANLNFPMTDAVKAIYQSPNNKGV
jgi:ABC-type amino acid transport substrate-binding protein